MKLTRFQIRKFRNIIDSGTVDVDEAVTCLVGMNEAGKTAVLTALNRLNPADGSKFDHHDDYPRWLLIADRRADVIGSTEPIEATFTLDAEDQAAVDEVLGSGVLAAGDEIVLSRKYGEDKVWWTTPSKAEVAVSNIIGRASVTADLRKRLAAASDIPQLIELIQAIRSEEDGKETADSARLADLDSLDAQIEVAVGEAAEKTTVRAVIRVLSPRVPRFFYFSNYSVLRGRINLNKLDVEATQRVGSTADQTARSLLLLADTTPEQMTGDDYEDRRAELEAVGNDLTQQVFRYWKQNPHLRVRFDVDRVPSDNPSHGQPPIITSYLDIRVEDTRHNFTNNFSQRSSGFQWFFSFLAAFTEFELRESNYVVLLDEPGLTLHGRAQADFLDFINDRLSGAAQVIYTTHSPFMVETDKLARVRIVEDAGPDVGATVGKEVLRVGQDSLFPLQAALGYDVVQHLFIGAANLVVEGPSDFIYLDTLSRLLADKGLAHLDPDWRILPAGGAANIPAFVALIGPALEVTALIDAGTEGAQRLLRAIEAGRLDQKRLVSVGEVTGNTNSDIEDVFSPGDYLTLYNAAFGAQIKVAELPAGDRIVKRIEQLTGNSFDHYKPAEHLLRDQSKLTSKLSDATVQRWAQLFERINASRA